MKKTFTLLFLAITLANSVSAQLLYKISGNGLEKSSYIIGTHHLANVGFLQKLDGVKTALTETDQVYGEVVFDDMTNADTLQALKAKTQLPEGQTIKTLLTPQEYKELDGCMKNLMGTGLSNPAVMQSMGHMTPQTLLTQLELILFMSRHMGEFDPTATFDQYFQTQAKHNSEPIGGLETVAFQAHTLYDVPMKRQIELLMCFVRNTERDAALMDRLTEAFYAQDLSKMEEAANEKYGNSCDATPEEQAALISRRNTAWMEKMPSIMTAHPTFFAVGALHLVGDEGLLQLLKKAGYEVEGIK